MQTRTRSMRAARKRHPTPRTHTHPGRLVVVAGIRVTIPIRVATVHRTRCHFVLIGVAIRRGPLITRTLKEVRILTFHRGRLGVRLGLGLGRLSRGILPIIGGRCLARWILPVIPVIPVIRGRCVIRGRILTGRCDRLGRCDDDRFRGDVRFRPWCEIRRLSRHIIIDLVVYQVHGRVPLTAMPRHM